MSGIFGWARLGVVALLLLLCNALVVQRRRDLLITTALTVSGELKATDTIWEGSEKCCASQAQVLAVFTCGDGLVEGWETCDDGGTVSGDGCSDKCQREFCGDAVVQAGLGEECDDGNSDQTDGCHACKESLCGNLRIDVGEECDDGNLFGDDGCNSTCALEIGARVGSGRAAPNDEVCTAIENLLDMREYYLDEDVTFRLDSGTYTFTSTCIVQFDGQGVITLISETETTADVTLENEIPGCTGDPGQLPELPMAWQLHVCRIRLLYDPGVQRAGASGEINHEESHARDCTTENLHTSYSARGGAELVLYGTITITGVPDQGCGVRAQWGALVCLSSGITVSAAVAGEGVGLCVNDMGHVWTGGSTNTFNNLQYGIWGIRMASIYIVDGKCNGGSYCVISDRNSDVDLRTITCDGSERCVTSMYGSFVRANNVIAIDVSCLGLYSTVQSGLAVIDSISLHGVVGGPCANDYAMVSHWGSALMLLTPVGSTSISGDWKYCYYLHEESWIHTYDDECTLGCTTCCYGTTSCGGGFEGERTLTDVD